MPDRRRTLWRFVRAVLLAWSAAAAALCTPAPATAVEGTPTPLEVRAVFLLHLARFVKWPDTPLDERDRAFVVGCYADDPIAPLLRQIVQGESIAGQPIELRQLRRPADFEGCDLVYLGDALGGSITRAIRRLRDRSILFVGNADRLIEAGGHVQFYPRDSQVRLRISPENLRASRLVPNSQLLRVATVR